MHALGTALAAWLLDQGYTDDITGTSLEGTWLAAGATPGGKLDILAITPSPTDEAAQRLARAEGGLRRPPSAAPPRPDVTDEGVKTEILTPSERGSVRPHAGAAGATPATRVARAGDAAPRRRRWPLVVLWLLALVGVAGAVTGYLQVPLPGVPPRVTRIGPWRVPWPRDAKPSHDSAPATAAPEPSAGAAPASAASSSPSRERPSTGR
jgi:hypothetical protein